MNVILAVTLLISVWGNLNGLHLHGEYAFMKPENGPVRLVHLVRLSKEGRVVPPENVNFLLYTQAHPQEPVWLGVDDIDGLLATDYDPSKRTFIYIHGWGGDGTSSSNIVAKDAVLSVEDANVFCVDWNPHADADYADAYVDIPEVAVWIGHYIKRMVAEAGLNLDNVHIMGHSMGSQVAGFVGQELEGQAAVIIGTDPAGPLYSEDPPELRLDATDAKFVQIIHTNTQFLGYAEPCGTVDLYPAGGTGMPGCEDDWIGACDHARSYRYYAEAIASQGFTSTQCDSWENYLGGLCEGNPTTSVASINVDTASSGVYYLNVNGDEPYSMG